MTEIENEREAGGLWCHDVLEALDAYIDGQLTDEVRAQVEAHVHACDNCARFGGAYGAVVTAIRGGIKPANVSTQRRARLQAALEAELGSAER